MQESQDIKILRSEIQKLQKQLNSLEELYGDSLKHTETLQEKLNLHRILIDNFEDLTVILDENWKHIYVSPSSHRMLGFRPDELIGLSTLDFVYPKDQERIAKTLSIVSKEDAPPMQPEIYRVIRKDGSTRYFRARAKNFMQDPMVKGIIIYIRDVTESIVAEQILRDTKDKFKLITENMFDLVALHDRNGMFLYVTPSFRRELGYSLKTLFDSSLHQICHPADQARIEKTLQALLEGQNTSHLLEARIKKSDGNYEWYEISLELIPGAEDSFSGIVSSSRNIQQKKENEVELKYKDYFLKSILKNSGIYLVGLDKDFTITFWEGRGPRTIGMKPEELVGRNIFELGFNLPKKSKAATRWALKGKSYSTVTEINGRNLEIYLSPFYGPDDEVNGVATISFDITERVRTEKEIRESLKEKESLLMEVHHRVKNNLQVVAGLFDFAEGKVHDPESLAYLKDCRNRIVSMSLIHEHLYSYGKFSSIDIGYYIEDLIKELQSSYAHEKIRFDLSIDVRTIEFSGNRAISLGLVLNEIISNAIKHAFKGRDKGNIQVRLEESSDWYILTISDDGQGFAPQINFDESDSIGFTLIRMFCRRINAKIKLDSSNSGGTKFELSFPHLETASSKV